MKSEELGTGQNRLLERTFEYARRIVRLYVHLKGDSVGKVLGHQCLRSGTSIGANYREAYRSRSKAEFAAKIGDCLKEAEETLYWLELMKAENLVTAKQVDSLIDETRQIIAMLVASRKTATTSTHS